MIVGSSPAVRATPVGSNRGISILMVLCFSFSAMPFAVLFSVQDQSFPLCTLCKGPLFKRFVVIAVGFVFFTRLLDLSS